MSLSKLNSGNADPFENGRRPSGSPPVPIACRVCDKVFSDNVSLLLHFECHMNVEFRQRGNDLASLHGGHQSSSSWAPCSHSSSARLNKDHNAFSSLNDCFRPHSLPAKRKKTDRNRLYIPVINVMPSVSPSTNPQLNGSQPIHNSSMGRYGGISSFSCPSMSSALDARNSACALRVAPPHLRKRNGGQKRSPGYKKSPISEVGKYNQEIIILSDDEEEDNKSVTEIDSTLKL